MFLRITPNFLLDVENIEAVQLDFRTNESDIGVRIRMKTGNTPRSYDFAGSEAETLRFYFNEACGVPIIDLAVLYEQREQVRAYKAELIRQREAQEAQQGQGQAVAPPLPLSSPRGFIRRSPQVIELAPPETHNPQSTVQ